MTIDLMSAQLLDDPIRGYAELRERAPLLRASSPGVTVPVWLVTRFAEVKAVLSDPRFVKDKNNVPGAGGPSVADQLMEGYGLPPEYRPYMETMLMMDGAEHARLRKLVTRAFTMRRVAALRPQVEQITDDLLAGLHGEVELLESFCFPLSGTVICELVGVDEPDRPMWRRWIFEFAAGDPARFADACRGMVEHTEQLIERRRAEPTDDLVSGLVRAQDEDHDRLTDAELIGMVLLLVQAGHHTTAHLVANATVVLLDHQDQLDRLRQDPALLPHAVHELLRFAGPVPLGGLVYATEDVEVSGVEIGRGDAVVCALVSANRDTRTYDAPDRFDITRDHGRAENHVAFAHGPHYCLGAALARLETEVALDRLFVRRQAPELAVPRDELEYRAAPGTKGLVRLPVRL